MKLATKIECLGSALSPIMNTNILQASEQFEKTTNGEADEFMQIVGNGNIILVLQCTLSVCISVCLSAFRNWRIQTLAVLKCNSH